MIQKVYLNHEGTGLPVMVGYNVRDLNSLEQMGYRIEHSSEDDYYEAREHGLVYIKGEMYDAQEESAFLYDWKGILIGTAYRIKKER